MHRGHHSDGMFLVHCPACGRRELRDTRSLLAFANTARGIEMRVACAACGAEVRMTTGRRADRGHAAQTAA